MALVSFLYPNYLWMLLLVPFFVFIYFFSLGYGRKKAFVFSNFQALERFYGIEFFSRNFLLLYLHIFIVILLVLAVSGTQIHYAGTTSASAYVLLIDNSGSMSTTDLSPSRFIAAKNAAKDFVDSLPAGSAVGVIGFSGEAIVYQDLTTDSIKVKNGIDAIDFGNVEGTNVYNAILAADKLFDSYPGDKERSVVLISDGQINAGEAPQIISFSERNEIVINTIGVGSPEGGLGQYNTIMKADVDFLKSLSFNSGGHFFRIEETNDFSESFDSLIEFVNADISYDISPYLLLLAVILFTLNWILVNFRFKTFP